MGGFVEVADRVHVLREPLLDVNVTLVVADGAALLVDTLSTVAQARELAAAVRAVTPHPLTVVNTHHHFDHCFGNAVLAADPARPVYAHPETARWLRDRPDELRRLAYEEMRAERPGLADELADAPLLAPTDEVHTETTLHVGGRPVLLRHPGRGHSAGDLVVQVPDADVLVVGDLVEQSGPPAFEESYPLQWPEAVAGLLRLVTASTTVVPGHGDLVDVDFVRAQHGQLADLAWLIRAGHTGGAPPERVAAEAPFGARAALVAARRGYAELDGTA
ncbi:MBL fold metallo-hydrolase [Micromonospora sp. WMMD882]|uniref:MBL fold metallo-hydrolase n=1 Tax=Micromonospora sp. WMMD882 TaxID=3015151 RepID=UPI00248C5EA2|nr:MBL fold metallo-hydrolase [Micromonospora sp. WMMD882]WBB82263.1 MBL fold metallo-hydrolase [Micromonospora sp. WMMD882]